MKTTPLISIILPVFNAETYIARCLDSILNQSYGNSEILVINDGSTDRTLSICKSFAASDKRVLVTSTKNHGVSAARNLGLTLCKGELIHFVDGDDFLPKDALSLLLEAHEAHTSDLTIGGFVKVKDTGEQFATVIDFPEVTTMTRNNVVDYLAGYFRNPRTNPALASCWGKLYKTDIIKSHGLAFNQSLSLSEDIAFNMDYLRHINTATFINAPTYNHQIYDSFSSLTSSFSETKLVGPFFLDFLSDSMQDFFTHCAPTHDFKKTIRQYYGYRLTTYSVRICGQMNKANFKIIYSFFKRLPNASRYYSCMNDYRPEKGNYRLLPLLLKYRLVLPFLYFGRRAALAFF